MELDHIFICTEKEAPQGDLLKEFGLVEGSSNTHPGQGTANRRFFFKNFMLELIWMNDLAEVQSELTKPMRLYERFSRKDDSVSPFGVALRPTNEVTEDSPLPSWDYNPLYLPDFLRIQVAENTPLSEPMYFYLSFVSRQDMVPEEKREAMDHKISIEELTSTVIHINQDNELSYSSSLINGIDNVSVLKDSENYIDLEFDNGVKGKSKDFRPSLPLVIRW